MTDKNENVVKGKFSAQEEEVLKFWNDNKIFEKSVEKVAPKGDYVFYDGPPFATGLPHYGHIVASLMKDAVPRYWTMKGCKVERKWGWDCHGLPIENIVEKEMGSKKKKDIEEMGVEKFNNLCREKVLTYVEDWKKVINRLGRWADMENSYKTMDIEFMESVWYVFKELYDKGLIYEGYRSMHICPRCETTLSQSEVTEGYKDIKDLSAIAKFELVDEPGTFVLAWTTTPWTLIGNVALAVGRDIEYLNVEIPVNFDFKKLNIELDIEPGNYIFSKEVAKRDNSNESKLHKLLFLATTGALKSTTFSGEWLIGKKYKPLFDYYSSQEKLENKSNGWKIYAGDFVTTADGTGVVHIAPAFGEDDMNLGKENNLPFIQHVGMDGIIKKDATDFAGLDLSPRAKNKPEEVREIDLTVTKFLSEKGLLFTKEKYEHSYSHCWRCDTALLNYATSSWFVAVTKIKTELLENAKNINWSPAHIKEGRFGNWLEGARDWSISRQRFWASVMPIWKCECGEIKVFGSVKELEEKSGEKITDIHKHVVDKIEIPCEKCSGKMKRIPDVLDTWFDSGSMPYAQMHYPFENKEKFEDNFPAEFIAEGSDQTRAWFYYLHVIGTGIKHKPAFKNVIVNGIVLAEDGKKMSKKLKNYPDPALVMNKYGADALRYYLLTSPVMLAENLNFSEKGVDEVLKKVLMILENVLSFYKIYEDQLESITNDIPRSENVLDQWIMSRLNETIKTVTENMEAYNLVKATRPIGEFVTDLSTWYIRRSRDRFKDENESDKQSALQTTRYVLLTLSQVIAPFMPFMAEHIYKEVKGGKESVHLDNWPVAGEIKIDVLRKMADTKDIVEKALAERGIKIKQPLNAVNIPEKSDVYIAIIQDELNVKNVNKVKDEKISFDTEITDELKQEGTLRELVRFINGIRKDAGLTIQDSINIYWESESEIVKKTFEVLGENLKKDTLASEIKNTKKELPENQQKDVKIDGEELWLGVEKK